MIKSNGSNKFDFLLRILSGKFFTLSEDHFSYPCSLGNIEVSGFIPWNMGWFNSKIKEIKKETWRESMHLFLNLMYLFCILIPTLFYNIVPPKQELRVCILLRNNSVYWYGYDWLEMTDRTIDF